MKLTRREFGLFAGATGLVAAGSNNVLAQQSAFFRIGTGGTAGTYYPVGGMLANAISNPPGLILTAQASNGSVANINAVTSGQAESGFSQADVAAWAYTGTGTLRGQGQGRGPAAHRQPLPRKPALRRHQELRRQVDRRPQGQARLARRAGLRHAGRCTHHPQGVRAFGKGHQAGISQAATSPPTRSRTARSTHSSSSAAFRPRRSPSWPRPAAASSCCRSTARRPRRSARSIQFFANDDDPRQHLQGRPRASRRSLSAPNG